MKVCVILPTYNERGNIARLLSSLLGVFDGLKRFDMHVLVADDHSPDGTGDVVLGFMEQHKNIHISAGEKQGLGMAYIRGFKCAMDELGADVVFQMDADFSHDPALIPRFLEEIEKGYDVVIGSRYVKGGDTPGWSFRRRVISRCGNLFLRYVGGLYKVNDCTTGFRAIRVSLLRQIDFGLLHTRGYAFLSTLLYELCAHGAKVKEIPMVFRDREFGETKLNQRDMVEFFFNSLRLRWRKSKRHLGR